MNPSFREVSAVMMPAPGTHPLEFKVIRPDAHHKWMDNGKQFQPVPADGFIGRRLQVCEPVCDNACRVKPPNCVNIDTGLPQAMFPAPLQPMHPPSLTCFMFDHALVTTAFDLMSAAELLMMTAACASQTRPITLYVDDGLYTNAHQLCINFALNAAPPT